ncbi:MAG: T9SS type A sorting domain-containing protein [Taibaiella sp.]
MKNILNCMAITAATFLVNYESKAQMPYLVTTLQENYVLLTNATNITAGNAWADTATFTFPVGFNFQFGGNTINTITLNETNLLVPALTGTQSGFAILGTSLQDRNYPGSEGVSPVSYKLSGTSGSRIFKMELRNAGFSNEKSLYGTSNDSVNLQVWIYESNSAIEFRFGPSSITHFPDYFQGKVPLGYIKNLSMDNFLFEKYYSLKGNPLNPGMDTVTNLNVAVGLDTYPASGTVYRFTPKTNSTGISRATKVTLGSVYPVPARDVLFIESKAEAYEILSLTGNILNRGKITGARTEVPLQQFAPGMYLIRLSNSRNEVDVHKFIRN